MGKLAILSLSKESLLTQIQLSWMMGKGGEKFMAVKGGDAMFESGATRIPSGRLEFNMSGNPTVVRSVEELVRLGFRVHSSLVVKAFGADAVETYYRLNSQKSK